MAPSITDRAREAFSSSGAYKPVPDHEIIGSTHSGLPSIGVTDIDGHTTAHDGRQSEDSLNHAFDEIEPTEEEQRTLRRVADELPSSAWIVALIELAERAAYYGISGPFQNYIQNKYKGTSGLPGALGLGQSAATRWTSLFQFFCYLTPVFGAIVADSYWGKVKTIVRFSFVYLIGLAVLFVTSLPIAIENGYAFTGLVTAMILVGLGTGGIKSNVSPLIAEQYTGTKETIRVLQSGERVIIDPAVTIERIYTLFYMCINIGSLSSMVTTELESKIGFWCAFLFPVCVFSLGFAALLSSRNSYINRPPHGSVVFHAFRVIWIGLRSGFDLDAARPSNQRAGRRFKVSWDDGAFSQMLNNFVSQAGTMELHGIPNDILSNIDALTVIAFIPVLNAVLYPFLQRFRIPFRPIARITVGFIFAACGMLYAAGLQHLIYSRPPCYDHPLHCDASKDGTIPNQIHVAIQIPAYLLIGFSEIFASVAGLEYAYTQAPPSMKSFTMSLFLLTTAGGSVLGMLIAPFANDPYLVWMYLGLATLCFVSGAVFWVLFRNEDKAKEQVIPLRRLE
ncbi:hypothetical protein BP5796_07713 [Coleophoma crateriformis]|uniref:Uncharacterized protein n=1 Tax=Coleophoma crateriformis TaxID=565419 RepID=A0A3D8RCA5_9HELO|nr:hypothetical protein BP5796_07713 [Coleophoma crateriformis]